MALRRVDLIPAQVDSLSHTQAVACHEKHQRGIPPAVAAVATSLYELLKLLCCEVTPPVAQCSFHINSPWINILTFRISPFGDLIAAPPNSIIFTRDRWRLSTYLSSLVRQVDSPWRIPHSFAAAALSIYSDVF